jgi:hypothetical protein
MKKSLISLGVILALTGCATSQDKYYEAVKAREDRMANEESRIDSQIAAMGASGDATAKGMAIMYFARKNTGAQAAGQIAPPQNQALEWARVLLNPLVSLYSINRNTTVQLANIEADTAQYGATLGTIGAISIKGMEEAGKVVFPPVYTVPMGSAPAEPVAPVAPVAETPATTPALTP